MKNRFVLLAFVMLLLTAVIPGSVSAQEAEHSFENGICSTCGTVGVPYLALEEEVEADWTLTQDLFLDLNSHDITGTINTNGYRIFGFDSATKNYMTNNMGSFSCTDQQGNAIVPEPYVQTFAELTGYDHRYLTIPYAGSYTFHRFYLGITHSSLKPMTTGFGYKALFCGDEMVKDALSDTNAFGFSLQLGNYRPVTVFKAGDELVSADPISLRIENWDVENHGETELTAVVKLFLADGTVIETDSYSVTLRQQVEAVNTAYQSYTQVQLDAIKDMVDRNPLMKTWNVNNFYITGYIFTDAPEVSKAYKLGSAISPLDQNYYFSGTTSSYYLATTDDYRLASDVYLEEVSGGYALYFMNGAVKTYINIVSRNSSGSSVSVVLSTSTPTVYTLNLQYKYIYTTIGSRKFYLGTYTNSSGTTYTTLSGSNTSYISDKSLIGVTQFPAWFFVPESTITPDDEDNTGGNTGGGTGEPCESHTDADNNGSCDICSVNVTVIIDLYALNDLHGKLADGDSHPGVDELSTYLANARAKKDNVILLSSGDMWQGAAESNLTRGLIMTDWMNEMDFVSMTMGNHEFDWGEEAIVENEEFAEFPFLAINIYDSDTKTQVDYCQSSVVVEADGIQIGIIGAIGDCYSSIATDKSEGVYFLTGSQLTALVKAEATSLRNQGVDFIVYSLHDGTSSGYGHYDTSLSNGYVDLVFEGHAHQSYAKMDTYGVYHIQAGGDNKGISYASVTCNTANGSSEVTAHQVISTSTYSALDPHPIVAELLEKYKDMLDIADKVLGNNPSKMYSSEILPIVAQLYCDAGVEKWGDQYDIVLGGGYLNCRSPYNLEAGEVTYGMLMNILPFDNQLVLCSISGQNLLSKFINSTNSNYYIGYSEYGQQISGQIQSSKTYYIIVDSYTAYYAPNKLTIIDFYDDGVYARDLFAEYIEEGNLNN